MNRVLAKLRLLTVAASLLGAATAWAQQPFDLDPSFRTSIRTMYVNSMATMDDGGVLISGQINFTNDQSSSDLGSARLFPDGTRDQSFPTFPETIGGGKLTPWNGQFYVGGGGAGGGVFRLLTSGYLDPTFDLPEYPLFGIGQGGDYHIFPDGSVVMSGWHTLNDPDHGFVGDYNLIWFNSDGTLDVTKTHRAGNGVIYEIEEQPDEKFLLSGTCTIWEGQPVAQTFRVNADGSLDGTFNAAITWGECQGFTTLADGRILASGLVKTASTSPDTLHLVRMLPDGSLDPSFNNSLVIRNEQFGQFLFLRHTLLPDGRIALHGIFDEVDGYSRNGFIVLDENGYLPATPLAGGGCGGFLDQISGFTRKGTTGMLFNTDGSIFIYGGYRGYDDGTTNDPQQRFVSRLYGLGVGVPEQSVVNLRLYPNPATRQATVEFDRVPMHGELVLSDALGRITLRQRAEGYVNTLELQDLSKGVYLLELRSDGKRVTAERLMVR